MKRATKLFVTERDVRVNSVGPQNLAFPRVSAWSHSLVGFSGVKLNPKSTWKSSTFIVIPRVTSLVPLDWVLAHISHLHLEFLPLTTWSKRFTQSFNYFPRIWKHNEYKYLIFSWDSAFVVGWGGKNPTTHFFSWVLHFYAFERIISCFLLIMYVLDCVCIDKYSASLGTSRRTVCLMVCSPATQQGPGIR